MIAHVFISGFVQGVGFRMFVRHQALKLGLTGWVRNLSDNRVEAVFQGAGQQIKQIATICKKGPFLSEVREITVDWVDESKIEVEEFKDFRIL